MTLLRLQYLGVGVVLGLMIAQFIILNTISLISLGGAIISGIAIFVVERAEKNLKNSGS